MDPVLQKRMSDTPPSPAGFRSPSRVKQLGNRLSLRRRKTKDKDEFFNQNTANTTSDDITYLSKLVAAALYEELVIEYKFCPAQITELIGLSSAMAIAKAYPIQNMIGHPTILVICGPGNNGRDGLSCARHLKLFGYTVTIFYPKQSNDPLVKNLVHQNEMTEVSTLAYLPADASLLKYNLIVDAIFGINFSGPKILDPFLDAVERLKQCNCPIVSLDVPSGWDADNGPADEEECLKPETLISVIAPKKCAKFFKGRYHYLAGRFIPTLLLQKYSINLPVYPGIDCAMEISPSATVETD